MPRYRVEPHGSIQQTFARIINRGPVPIYVTIEDAEEVDARENSLGGAFWDTPVSVIPTPRLTAQDLENAYGRIQEHDSRMFERLGATPPGSVVQVPHRTMRWEDMAEIERRQLEMMEAQRLRQEMLREVAGRAAITPEARARARELLLSHCTEEQKGWWNVGGFMEVRGSLGPFYRLDQRGVTRINDHHQFCLQIVGEAVPVEDAVLMRKLLIETNEPEFLRLANDLMETRNRGPQIPPDQMWRQLREVADERQEALDPIRRILRSLGLIDDPR